MTTLHCIFLAWLILEIFGLSGYIIAAKIDYEKVFNNKKEIFYAFIFAPICIFIWCFIIPHWLGMAKHLDSAEITNARIDPKLSKIIKDYNRELKTLGIEN